MAQRYIFVGGLHRSGTSILARLIAAHPQVRGITGAPVPEQEGVYLQGAIPHTAQSGRPLHFATDPAQHLIEAGPHDRLETRDRLASDWDRWFAPGGDWRVEKSPVNLTRMRLYQQLFPASQFIVILRHPQAMARALEKWGHSNTEAAVDHWIAAHRIVEADLDFLHSVMVLRYEDLVARPDRIRSAIFSFLQLGAGDADQSEAIRGQNQKYDPPPPLRPDQAQALARWGYGDGFRTTPIAPQVRHALRGAREKTIQALETD